ncbi:MAG: hypothetical protein M1818_006084 [Claussenomyces sp. TS43310]|nr:MAG: hypothetical protein M1818_006084 [Claussenomyces sp. TS43310]
MSLQPFVHQSSDFFTQSAKICKTVSSARPSILNPPANTKYLVHSTVSKMRASQSAPSHHASVLNDPSSLASEHSFGIIPIRYTHDLQRGVAGDPGPRTANTEVLLILQKTAPQLRLPPFWTFPKGHAEPADAEPLQTAMRELKEETGLLLPPEHVFRPRRAAHGLRYGSGGGEAEGNGGNGSLVERYRNPLKGWIKEVRYWVGLIERGGMMGDDGKEIIVVQEKEVADARWLRWEDAMELLSMEGLRIIMRQAMEMLDADEEICS